MADLTTRSGSRLSRRQRTEKTYRLVLATGGAALATAVTFVLALITSFSFFWVFLLGVLTIVLGMATSRVMR